jgi:hypothetical protein
MTTTHPELHTSRQFQELIRTSGTEDDADDRDDEHAGENEAQVRAVNEGTEAPEEFEVDQRDQLGQPDDDGADEGDDEEAMASPERLAPPAEHPFTSARVSMQGTRHETSVS